ncbi:hypothetical protein LIER_00887 [Lithospermum erythrorhizon]|uniref:Uncharacterized protein n=1 Tax=Lithospermum erythrorhizon TaxID=34254 RepID=A0AAV3NKG6_LITER
MAYFLSGPTELEHFCGPKDRQDCRRPVAFKMVFHKRWYGRGAPKAWVPLWDAKRPTVPKKMYVVVRAQLETLKQVFDRPLHYKVFCEEGVLIQAGLIRSKEYDPTLVPPVSWDEVLDAAQRCVEPKDVPFFTMTGERRPLVRKSKVRKVLGSSSTPARNEPSPSSATAAATSTSTATKRPVPEERLPKAFAPRKKHAAQRPMRIEYVTISEDLSTTSAPPVPTDSVNLPSPVSMQEMPHLPSGSLNEDGADSGPRVSLGYSANFLNLPYTLPGGLKVTADTTLYKKQEPFKLQGR